VFEFKMPGDKKVYKVPKLKYIRPALIEQLDGGKKSEIMSALIEAYHPGLYAKFDDADQLVDLYEAWAEASGISMGESSGSTASSASTESPSAETSSSPAEASTS
jgi:hypothetical protein